MKPSRNPVIVAALSISLWGQTRVGSPNRCGAAPGYPGYYQVNFVRTDGVPPGPAVSVRLTYIGRSSNTVTIGVQ